MLPPTPNVTPWNETMDHTSYKKPAIRQNVTKAVAALAMPCTWIIIGTAILTIPMPALAFGGGAATPTPIIAQQNSAFDQFGGSYNQSAVGAALQSLSARSVLRTSLLSQLPADSSNGRSEYDRLSGEIHASVSTQMIDDSQFARDDVLARLSQTSCGAGCIRGSHVWAIASAAQGHQGSDGNAGSISRDMGGVMGGIDTLIFDNAWRVGLLFGYAHSNLDADSRYSTASTHDTTYGAYAGTEWGNVSLKLGATYARHDISADRLIQVPGLVPGQAISNYYGNTSQVFGELGYQLQWGAAAWQPYLQLAQVHQNFEAFQEAGSPASLSGRSQQANVTFSTLGVHLVTKSFQLGTVPVSVRAGIVWRHAVGDVDLSHEMAFRGGSIFNVRGATVSRNVAEANAGLDFALASNAIFSLIYNGNAGSQRMVDQSLTAALTVRL